jgi:unsaturated rhamnogalacturonyl hydrolase
MENDPANADLDHFNLIAQKFGLHFDNVLKHHVIDPHYGPGFIPVTGDAPIFHHPHTLYMKDTCGISVKAPASAVFSDKDGIVIASAKYGKGMAVAVIDPWLYNEYTDHRKVNPAQQNFAAGQEFALWLIQLTQAGAPPPHPHPQPAHAKESR